LGHNSARGDDTDDGNDELAGGRLGTLAALPLSTLALALGWRRGGEVVVRRRGGVEHLSEGVVRGFEHG